MHKMESRVQQLYKEAKEKQRAEELAISTQQGKISGITDRLKVEMASLKEKYESLEDAEIRELYRPFMESYDENKLQDPVYVKQMFVMMQDMLKEIENLAERLVNSQEQTK